MQESKRFSERSLEIAGTIWVPGDEAAASRTGIFLKNSESNKMLGMTYEQAWDIIEKKGARNAKAADQQRLNPLDGAPPFEDFTWRIPAYSKSGAPFAEWTEEAAARIEEGMIRSVQKSIEQRASRQEQPFSADTLAALDGISQLIKSAGQIAVLAGAGASTNSGIPDYRSSAESIWKKNPFVLAKLNQTTFEAEPQAFWEAFYDLIEGSLEPLLPFPVQEAVIAAVKAIQPNETHRFFSWLDHECGKNVTVITQNVDGLDAKAGSTRTLEMHGNIHECVCLKCGEVYKLADVLRKYRVPSCRCGGVLRPNVVFFGDAVRYYDEAISAVKNADLVIVAGTSLSVSPFNQLVYAKNLTASLVLLNNREPEGRFHFHHQAYGDIGALCRALKNKLPENKQA